MVKISFPEAWEEAALVSVTQYAATPIAVQCAAMTESIDINEPDYPGESIPNLAGGRAWKQSPMEDGEITLEIYPIEVDTAAGDTGLFSQYVGGTYGTGAGSNETDTSWVAGVSRLRDRYRVTVLWTNDTTPPTTAEAQVASASEALRFSAMGCRIISHKTSFTDGIVKATVTFKFPAMNYAGDTMMFRWDSTDATAVLAAIAAYDDEDSWT